MKYLVTFCFLMLALVQAGAQTMNAQDDSQNAGKVVFENRQIDAGTIAQGVPVTREFTLKNISSEVMTLEKVRSGCHCTTVAYDNKPVPPGENVVIKATFDAQTVGPFYKIITVTTNFDPDVPVALVFRGTVAEPQPESQH